MARKKIALRPESRDVLNVLGAQVRFARQFEGITIEHLARRAGVSARTVSLVERGSPNVSAGHLFNIAAVAGVALFGTDDPEHTALLSAAAQAQASALPKRVVRKSGPQRFDDDF